MQLDASPSPADLNAAEIRAYIAIRDNLLTAAEATLSHARLDAAAIANEAIASMVQPARPPYEAQHLPEAQAIGERRRCAAVANRVSELRAFLNRPVRRAA